MKNIDFDRAFPQTPDCIHAAIKLGIKRGKKNMKMRNKIISMSSIAAGIVLVLCVALAMGIQRPETPDVLSQPPLNINSALASPDAQDILKAPKNEAFTVYTTESGHYYHLDEQCGGMENAVAMTETEAMQRSKRPCPICIPLTCSGHSGDEINFVYYSEGGIYFHKNQECSGGEMPLKSEYFTLLREAPGKQPCPACLPRGVQTCIHGYLSEPPAETPVSTDMPEASPEPETQAVSKKSSRSSGKSSDKSTVYYTENGFYYHSDRTCNGMQNASAHSREEARITGKIGCPYCLQVYCTENGSFYHLFPDCIGMQGASLHSVKEAREMATPKTRCATCLSPAKVFATEMGRYCHVDRECSGMQDPTAMPLDIAVVEKNKQLCPVCITPKTSIPDYVGMSVYYAPAETHYHSDTTCALRSKAGDRHSVEDARTAGKLPCSCAAVYYSQDGGYYHVLPDCMGGSQALVGNIQEATAANTSRCPLCLSPATVYATKAGRYFHARRYCSGMMNAAGSTPETEWANGKTPCPACIASYPQDIYVGGDRTDYNLHYNLFGTAFGNLEQAAAARYGFMEKADGSWRLTDGSHTACISRLYGFENETHPEAKWALEVLLYDPDNSAFNDPDSSYTVRENSNTFMNSVHAMPMMTMYSSAVSAMKNHLANAHPGNEEALFSHVGAVKVYFDESLEICACEMIFPCAMHSVHVQITPEDETSTDRTWRVGTVLRSA